MSDESFSVTTEQSWGGRIMDSIKGILVGLVFFIASFPILFINEGCAVRIRKGLNHVQKETVSVSADKSDPVNDGKPVHVTAKATTTETLQDPVFKVKAAGIKLVRHVQMYQWKEKEESSGERKKVGGSSSTRKEYTYSKVWSDTHQNHKDFEFEEGHENPSEMPYTSDTVQATVVTAGAFELSPNLVSQIKGEKPIKPEESVLRSLPERLKAKATIAGNEIYIGETPTQPSVGDLKISFAKVVPAEVTVIAKQRGTILETYKTPSDFKFERLEMGNMSAEEIFAKAHGENEMRTWALRVGGFLAMLIGMFLVLRPIAVLGDVVPFIGNIVGGALFVVSTLVAVGLSLITMSIAWIVYRPLIGVPLFVVGVAALVMVILKKKSAPSESHQGF